MTEQEQISMMAKTYCHNEFKCGTNCQTEGCRVYDLCKTLYNAGYRKVEEVRKETAKEILQILNTINNGAIKLIVKELAERFGVEVEE